MGRAWLLCAGPQRHRLRPRGCGARGFSGVRCRASQAPRRRQLHFGGDRRDRVWRTGSRGRHQRRARDRSAERASGTRQAAGRSAAARHDPGGAGRRFHAGDDGPWRDDLPPPGAAVQQLPAKARLRGLCERRSRDVSGREEEGRSSAEARDRVVDRARRLCVAGPAAAARDARGNGGAAGPRMDRDAAALARCDRRRPSRLHPSAASNPSGRAGGIRSAGWARRAFPPSTGRLQTWRWQLRRSPARRLEEGRTRP